MFCNKLKLKAYFSGMAVVLGTLVVTTAGYAATYVLPKGDVVGQVQFTTASASDTLIDIARHYDVGVRAIQQANPHLDPWLPSPGARVLIPSRHILPSGPREGIVINIAEMRLYYYYYPEVEAKKLADAEAAQQAELEAKQQAELAAQQQAAADPTATATTDPTATTTTDPATTATTDPAEAPIMPVIIPKREAAVLGPPLVSVYPISISHECLAIPPGSYKVEQRLSQPSWSVPASARAAQPNLPDVVPPGPNNPLGDFAIVINSPNFMIHGTNRSSSIGMKVGTGCVRMYPDDIDLLIHRVSTETPVRIVNESIKRGYKNGALYLEFTKPESAKGELNHAALVNWMSTITSSPMDVTEWQRVRMVAEGAHGIAMPVLQQRSRPRPDTGLILKLSSYKTRASAHSLINRIEALGVPLTITDCHSGKLCTVVAGPFKNRVYVEELQKKIKWVIGVKGTIVSYREEDDFQRPLLKTQVAQSE